jgi:malonate decarboxylase beta subunit
MMHDPATDKGSSWLQATARQRLDGLLDPGSFVEFIGPEQRVESPHLQIFDLPKAFDDGVIIGRATLDGHAVLVAAQEGQFMGGTFGEVSGAKLVGLVRAASFDKAPPQTILLLLDSGGVRLQEANAGELAVAELMRAIVQARCAGVAVIALIGGKAGCFGGAGLTAATCARVVISEAGRIGVTGPEVIETNQGIEEYDSRDKALVWSVCGGKNRRLIGMADAFTDDTMQSFCAAALAQIPLCKTLDLATLLAEQDRLSRRQSVLGACDDAVSMWKQLGIPHPESVSALETEDFIALADSLKEANNDAR